MRIIYGEAFDSGMVPRQIEEGQVKKGELICGPMRLLEELELRLGLTGLYPNNVLRVEQFRQAILKVEDKTHFYWESFFKDEYAVAKDLLRKRDELVLSGYDLSNKEAPKRIQQLSKLNEASELSPGTADRYAAVYKELDSDLGIEVISYSKLDELSAPVRRIFKKLKVEYQKSELPKEAQTDLGVFQSYLVSNERSKVKLKGDGSLQVWKANSEMELAEVLSQELSKSGGRPFVYNPSGQVILNESILMEGLPSLGSSSSSSARPSLQLLPLLQSFLWEPMDPKRMLEFLTLPAKPLSKRLSRKLAGVIAGRPGMGSLKWKEAIEKAVEELDEKQKERALDNYKILFERKRFEINEKIPVDEVIDLYSWLGKYCRGRSDLREDDHSASLAIVASCCKELTNILTEIKKTNNEIDKLFLESLISDLTPETINKGTKDQVGQLSSFGDSRCLISSVPSLIWYPFVQENDSVRASFWNKAELSFLEENGAEIPDPSVVNLQWVNHSINLIRSAGEKLILCIPEKMEGDKVHPHSLYVDLVAMAENIEVIEKDGAEFRVDKETMDLPSLDRFLQLAPSPLLKAREKESFSSLENLFFYPSEWFLNYVAKIRSGSLLDISDGPLLLGNLSHGLIEDFYSEHKDISTIDDALIESWVDKNFNPHIKREGANLLMPGRTNDLIHLRITVLDALKNITNHAKDNNWELLGPEEEFESSFCGASFGGFADLVFKREDELAIVDVKWGSKAKRRDQLAKNEDLQLAFYSKLFKDNKKFDHTAFYILSAGTLMAKDKAAFKDADVPGGDSDLQSAYQELWERMEKTYELRMNEIKAGRIEIRNDFTVKIPNSIYAGADTLKIPDKVNQYSEYDNITGWSVENDEE